MDSDIVDEQLNQININMRCIEILYFLCELLFIHLKIINI